MDRLDRETSDTQSNTFGEQTQLTLTLDQPVDTDVTVVVELSAGGVVDCPSAVTIPEGLDRVGSPVLALGFGTVQVTAILPDGLGAGATSAQIEVVPAGLGTRRPSGRRSP